MPNPGLNMRLCHLIARARRGDAKEEYVGDEAIRGDQRARQSFAFAVLESLVVRGVAESKTRFCAGAIPLAEAARQRRASRTSRERAGRDSTPSAAECLAPRRQCCRAPRRFCREKQRAFHYKR